MSYREPDEVRPWSVHEMDKAHLDEATRAYNQISTVESSLVHTNAAGQITGFGDSSMYRRSAQEMQEIRNHWMAAQIRQSGIGRGVRHQADRLGVDQEAVMHQYYVGQIECEIEDAIRREDNLRQQEVQAWKARLRKRAERLAKFKRLIFFWRYR